MKISGKGKGKKKSGEGMGSRELPWNPTGFTVIRTDESFRGRTFFADALLS